MDYDKLIEQLRHFGKGLGAIPISDIIRQYIRDAATAIEALRADLARVTAERDGAVAALRRTDHEAAN